MKAPLFFLALVLVGLVGCTPKRDEIPVYHESSEAAAKLAAGLEAKEKGGTVLVVSRESHSMAPTILPGDYLVAVPTPFDALHVGQVVNYRPDWNEKRLTTHRLVGTWPSGAFIAEGDDKANRSETTSQVDATNYVSRVISSHRYP